METSESVLEQALVSIRVAPALSAGWLWEMRQRGWK